MTQATIKNNSILKPRWKSREVLVGEVGIGGANPIRVQSMTNTNTLDIEATSTQIVRLARVGAELVRLAVQSPAHARAISSIKQILRTKYNLNIPLIADIHFSTDAAMEALKWADKIRLNPGNLLDKKIFALKKYTAKTYNEELKRIEKGLMPFINALHEIKKPIRIGANHGSLSDRILAKYGNTPHGMVESVMEYLRIFTKHKFFQIIVALKAANPLIMIEANRLLISAMEKEKMNYPVHLGVTEAGSGDEARAKSAIGIGTLLMDGIGDTIRVSLTEKPEKEISAAYSILQATRRRITKAEIISCPSCGRTLFDINLAVKHAKEKLEHLCGLKIAIMGCVVNGLGEMADADFGYLGSKPGKIDLYWQCQLIKRDISEKNALNELIKLIKKQKMWQNK